MSTRYDTMSTHFDTSDHSIWGFRNGEQFFDAENEEERPKTEVFKKMWQTVLPLWDKALVVLLANYWGNRKVEILCAGGLGFISCLQAKYTLPKGLGERLRAEITDLAGELGLVMSNLFLNSDGISSTLNLNAEQEKDFERVLRILVYMTTTFCFTQNALVRHQDLPTLDPTKLHPSERRKLVLSSYSKTLPLAIYYLALGALGVGLIAMSEKDPKFSKEILSLDGDGGSLLLGYTLGNALLTSFYKIHKKCGFPVKICHKYGIGSYEFQNPVLASIWSTSLKIFDIAKNVLPGFIILFNEKLSLGALGLVSALTRGQQVREYQQLNVKRMIQEQKEVFNLDINQERQSIVSARKVENIKTAVWGLVVLAFVIWGISTNDWHTGAVLVSLYACFLGGYFISRAVDKLIRGGYNNRLVNQIDFELNINSYLFLFVYVFLHTKLLLLDSDVEASEGVKYALSIIMYGILGLMLGSNRGRVTSLTNAKRETASSFAITMLTSSSSEFYFLKPS